MNWDIVKFAVDSLRWPVAGLSALLIFRRPISDLLYRVRGFKAGKDVSFDASTPEPNQTEARPETGLKSPEAQARLVAVPHQTEAKLETGGSAEAQARLLAAYKSRASLGVLEREKAIRADLESWQLDSTVARDLLIHQLALFQALFHYELVYRMIFGTQIALLKHLNVQGSTRSLIQTWYSDVARIRFPTEYPFDQWLNFLSSNGLISEAEDGRLVIALDGREFLRWMVAAGVPENKQF